MTKRIFLSFGAGTTPWSVLAEMLTTVGCHEIVAKGENFANHYHYTFDADDPRLPKLRAALRKRPEFRWSERVEHVYADSELRSFPFVHLIVDRKEIAPFGPRHGTTYDLGRACPVCGTGAVQISPFYSPDRAFPKSGLIVKSSTETFVAEALAEALRRAEITGLELRQVRSSRDHGPLPWWQIIPVHTMPKMDKATKGLIHGSPPPCSSCRRDGHYHTTQQPEGIVYAKKDVDPDALPDIVQTWECFGKSRIDRDDFKQSRLAEPAILVKPRVFDIFRRLKVKHAVFSPVRIE